MKRTTTMLALATALILVSTPAAGQGEAPDPGPRRHSIGSSLFVLVNLVPMENSPGFFQLSYGYRLTERDVVSLEAVTWKFQWPLGIPLGPSFDDEEERYPGSVREYGVGVAHWPIDTNVPAGFAEKDGRWPRYHVEPGLHFGVRF